MVIFYHYILIKKKGGLEVSTWSCDQQVCCSCRFWGGRRDIEFTGSFYEALEEKGKCFAPQGGFRGVEMGEGSSCSDWESYKSKR